MISLVDATELRYVLRPTVYRPPVEPAGLSVPVRRAFDRASDDLGSFAVQNTGMTHGAEVSARER